MSLGLAYGFVAALAFAGLDAVRKQLTARFDGAWSGPVALVVLLTLGQLPFFGGWIALSEARLEVGWVLPGVATLLLQIGANLLFVRAVQVSPLSLTVPFLALTPVFAVAGSALLLGELPSARQGAGIGAVVAGALFLHRGGLWRGLREEPGSAMMIGVAAIWAVTGNLDKLCLDHATPAVHAGLLNAGTGVVLLALLAARRELGALGHLREAPGLYGLAVLFAAAALGFQLLSFASELVPVIETLKRAVGLTASVVLGRLLFGEPVNGRKVGAVGAMIVGTALQL